MKKNENSIGILDSGSGGLSVYREIKKQLPQEHVIYFGDTFYSPYGGKKEQQIFERVKIILEYLIAQNIKTIIIACNTADVITLNMLQDIYEFPLFGVILPGVIETISATKNKRIAIIGTEVTLRSKIHTQLINKINPSIAVFTNPCNNQIIKEMEENSLKDVEKITALIKECLNPFKNKNIDTLLLGCTHYPFLRKYIKKECKSDINIVDPAGFTVKQVSYWLAKNNLLNSFKDLPDLFYISGNPDIFLETATNLLGYKPGEIKKIDI